MGDMTAEPSMEGILSSIKRIIAEEGEAGIPAPSRRIGMPGAPRLTPVPPPGDVLELSQAMPPVEPPPPPPIDFSAIREANVRIDTILSDRAAEASRDALETLSRVVVKPSVPGSDTLEGMVRDMLRPMLREWLDANLPKIVEEMVAREISRISGQH